MLAASSPSETVIEAIKYFNLADGELSNTPPVDFLKTDEKEAVYSDNKFRVSLYKIILFIHIFDGIKSGKLNLRYSYRYKAIHEYLIDDASVGVNEDTLKNIINWCFSLKNIQLANNKILSVTNKLSLANAYCKNPVEIHTGSDGSKVNVAVDSIFASHSFKYFGKGKGVTIYTFIDERQLLFHSVVISSSEREAAYVIDGLVQNEVVKSDIHSTDTHGYTELVFCGSHFIKTAFAPRIKKSPIKAFTHFQIKKLTKVVDIKYYLMAQ